MGTQQGSITKHTPFSTLLFHAACFIHPKSLSYYANRPCIHLCDLRWKPIKGQANTNAISPQETWTARCFICKYSRRLFWIGEKSTSRWQRPSKWHACVYIFGDPWSVFSSCALWNTDVWLARTTDGFPEGSCKIHIWCDRFRRVRLALEHIKQNIICNTSNWDLSDKCLVRSSSKRATLKTALLKSIYFAKWKAR